jgi:hypothetical protein
MRARVMGSLCVDSTIVGRLRTLFDHAEQDLRRREREIRRGKRERAEPWRGRPTRNRRDRSRNGTAWRPGVFPSD